MQPGIPSEPHKTLPNFDTLTPETLQARAQERLDEVEELMAFMLTEVDSINYRPTYGNTLGILDKIRNAIGWEGEAGREEMLMAAVHPDAAIRRAAAEAQGELQRYWREIYFNEGAYHAIKKFSEGEGLQALNEEQRRLLKNTLHEFKLAGQELEPEGREILRELRTELDEKSGKFRSNLLEKKELHLTLEELSSLPEEIVNSLAYEEDPVSGGRIINGNVGANVNKILTYAKDRDLRKRAYIAFNSVGVPENERLLQEIADLRLKVAQLLGYPSWAHMQTEEQMAGSPEGVGEFFEEIAGPLQEKVAFELAQMQRLLHAEGHEGPMQAYDIAYYKNKMRESFGVDDQVVAEYLPIEAVLSGMFSIMGEEFGVIFEEVEGASTWHEDVKAYRVKDLETGENLSTFYVDLFPREGKRGGAATYVLEYGHKLDSGNFQQPVTVMVANLTPPANGRPSLLQPGELAVPFHEMGHVLHIAFARTDTVRYAGDNTQQDFREAPSQTTEQWSTTPRTLQALGRHHLTGEPLPQQLAKDLGGVEDFGSSLAEIRKVCDSIVDAGMHGPQGSGGIEAARQRAGELAGVPRVDGVNSYARLHHLTYDSYAGRYYSYPWSGVYADRISEEFRTDPQAGRRFRAMLRHGGSLPARQLVGEYFGSKVSPITGHPPTAIGGKRLHGQPGGPGESFFGGRRR